MLRSLLIVPAILLTGCSAPDVRVTSVATAAVPAAERVSIRYQSVEVMSVTLPTYADSEDIFVEAPDGTLSALGPLWSDEPSRAVTLQIAQDLGDMSGRIVAPEPWPFRDFAAARLDIRIVDFHATAAGSFRIAGQYFVAPDEGGRDISRSFDINVPIGGDVSVQAISAARFMAIRELANDIARDGLK